MPSQNLNPKSLALNIRRNALRMVFHAGASHIASALSIADILAVLYGRIMNIESSNIDDDERDRFILSKGHACVSLYSVLAEIGILSQQDLDSYGKDFSWLMNHASHKVPGVEFSTGALGHGLPFGVGKALAGKLKKRNYTTYVLLSDGEMDEGSNWEALLFAAHHKLDNLVAIIDYNKLQSLGSVESTLGLEPLVDKIKAFGWAVKECDGHDHDSMGNILMSKGKVGPLMLIAHTTKGKGVSFMEDRVEWHYKNPSEIQLLDALSELERKNA